MPSLVQRTLERACWPLTCCAELAAGDRKTIDFPLKSRRNVSILYPFWQPGSRDGFGTILPSNMWSWPHALTTRVKRCEPANTGFRRCGPGHTNQGCLSSRVACVEVLFVTGQPRRFRDDFTLQKTVNVLPGPHALTTRVTICGTGHTGFRRCGQCHILEGCLSNGVAGAAFRANLEGPRGYNPYHQA